MVPIKHLLNETGVDQIFKLIVPEGNYAGEYITSMPKGWNEVDSIVSINDEFFNVEDFIIGDNTKLKFTEFTDKKTFDLIRNVYNEQGGDGRLIFKWIAEKDGIQYDLLSENFEINLNKKSESFDKSMMMTEVELKKSEAQNKIYTREDTTIDLFETKDLDENDIEPVSVFDIGFKKGDRVLSNFYTYDISQRKTIYVDHQSVTKALPSFRRSNDYEFGTNTNQMCGYRERPFYPPISQGPFVSTNITLKNIKIEISNMSIGLIFRTGTLYAVINGANNSERLVPLENTIPNPSTPAIGMINIDNKTYVLSDGLLPGESLSLEIRPSDNGEFYMTSQKTDTSIEITTDMEAPLVRTKAVRLFDAINQLAKNYSAGEITAESFILDEGGNYYDTSISTGIYLRGLPAVYLSQKLKTSLKALFQEGAAKLLALGFDVLGSKFVVEDINYFFKDLKCYDLSEKLYLNEDFKIENDPDVSYNNLMFGSKKYSTNQKFDIKNFNTVIEVNTPIKSNKNKFDKQADLIIDPYKIKEMIEDKSSSTNDNDDDKVLIDMVKVVDYWDYGVFENCTHSIVSGYLQLSCTQTSFDTTLMEVGKLVQITEGLNEGSWTILEIVDFKLKLDKTTGIQEGTNDTPIRYEITSLTKNRTIEGFTGYNNTIWSAETTTNIRYNPKYQLARWFPYFGSGLRKKISTELLKVASYKNNSEAQMTIVAPDMPNELQGEVIVGGNETLARMRDYKATFFNGEKIEVSFNKVTFEEFFDIYNNWKFGEGNDRTKSRGYISCNTPYGIYDIYPFGATAFSHNKAKNTLSIKGKVKGKSVENPVLLNVVQLDKNTVTLVWDYLVDYINPVIKIQYSLDGVNWETVHTVNNVKTATFSNLVFNSIMTGENVYFRIIASTADFYNKVSNSLGIIWQFNDWVLKEISRTENTNCGNSYLTFEVRGTVDLEITWNYEDNPGSGGYSAIDSVAGLPIAEFESTPGGFGETDQQITTLSISNEIRSFYIHLKNATVGGFPEPRALNCNSGNHTLYVFSMLSIDLKDLATDEVTNITLTADTLKKYFYRPPNPIDPDLP
jgi:hypothetical protein